MKSNINRRKEIFKDALPSKDSPEYESVTSRIENRAQSPEEKKFIKDCYKKATNSLEAQYLSHCDFITEITLRHFLMEFNNRAWEHGLRSMPLLFNILESYFIYRKPHQYFELLEEENYLISFYDFLDFYTSDKLKYNKELILDNLVTDIIYNFNIGTDLNEITFKTDDNAEFILSGISMIRRENEVTILLITGCNEAKEVKTSDIKLETDNPDKLSLIEQFKEDAKEDVKEDVKEDFQKPLFVDKDENFSKVLVACRLDLTTDTIDAKYVAEEFENFFQIQTNEIDGFADVNGEYLSKEYEEIHENGIKRVKQFDAIFEIAKASLYLPYYLSDNEDAILEETHDTEFKKINSNPIKKRKFRDTFGYKTSNKPLYIINTNNVFSPNKIKLRDDLFKIETSGYWKNLGVDQIGTDKKGNPIHSKTWVNKKISWYEATNKELIVEKNSNKFTGKNSGYIYVVRTPTMANNIFKIGLTRNDVELRVKQLSNTSIPDKFYKVQEWNVADCVEAEKQIHEILDDYRIDQRREFFEIDFSKAVETISKVCDSINKNVA
tara:strand:+ start:893 stop:2548 length:1656 start_codon:yes stop_codon:yes gene_type:complete